MQYFKERFLNTVNQAVTHGIVNNLFLLKCCFPAVSKYSNNSIIIFPESIVFLPRCYL